MVEKSIKDFLGPNKNGRFKQEYYHPKNINKYIGDPEKIIYRSSWERKFMIWLDLNDSVLEWSSEPIAIKYFYPQDQKYHKYYPDFYFKIKKQDGSEVKYLVECKPSSQLQKPQMPKRRTPKTIKNYNYLMEAFTKNYVKVVAAREWCKQNGFEFTFITENSGLF